MKNVKFSVQLKDTLSQKIISLHTKWPQNLKLYQKHDQIQGTLNQSIEFLKLGEIEIHQDLSVIGGRSKIQFDYLA